eukprot:GHVU01016567.1.p1 GENE.GHVU01016567.1~~GHVU01016567.1.p1  ORF type:complete len:100 (+),score=16.23 GHVU01016567.1:24-302(+)
MGYKTPLSTPEDQMNRYDRAQSRDIAKESRRSLQLEFVEDLAADNPLPENINDNHDKCVETITRLKKGNNIAYVEEKLSSFKFSDAFFGERE